MGSVIETNQTGSHIIHDIGLSSRVGSYSDAIEVMSGARWLYTSGAIGMTQEGYLPDDIEEQAELAWKSTLKLLEKAQMTIADVVKVCQFLARPEDIPAYAKIRRNFLGNLRPASTLLITPQMGWPGCLVEVEIVAAVKS